ncbi:MAG: glycoside hydrolase [Pirellulaceae bacterium]|nr:glycoside hydrolase [Pirellulaceae bacterium]
MAVCDARVERPADAINNIDLAMKRSFDNGRSWEPLQILADFPGQQAAADPCMLVDRTTDTVWIAYNYVLDKLVSSDLRKQERRAIALHLIHSRDDGQTWSKATDITRTVTGPGWEAVMAAPGSGIQTRAGQLIFPVYSRQPDQDYSHLLLSNDHGKTWQISSAAARMVNECQVAELKNGTLMLNMRSYRKQECRAVATTSDSGKTWTEVIDDKNLPEPTCQASFIRYTDVRDGFSRNRLLFVNPANTSQRVNLTIRLSYDEGKTWPISKVIHPGPSAYSCPTVLPDGTIGLIYENGRESPYERLTFARFDLQWLTDGRDRIIKKKRPAGL